MARLKFSETLKNKRHELGLTISQASAVLKLKESVLIAFEEGDFENMPKSGYAQGMLASYARYLGLSPRELVDMYSEELYEYIHGSSSHDLRRRTRDTRSGRIIDGYDVPNESESRPKAYVQLQSFLPTAGGPMGDYGAFATTSGVHSRSTGAVVPTNTPASGQMSYASPYGYSDQAYGSSYNGTYSLDRQSRAGRRRNDGEGARSRSRTMRRDDITTRSVSSGQYRDDRAPEDEGVVPYESASSERGRLSSRNITPIERPNIDRSRYRSRDERGRRGSKKPQGGIMGLLGDSRTALFAVIAALAIALTALAIFSIRSCVSNRGAEQKQSHSVGVTPAQPDDGSQTADGSDAAGTPGADGGAAAEPASTAGASEQVPVNIAKPAEPTVVMVKVNVADGQVSWLEITADGASAIADTVNGPWEQTYDVKSQLVVRASDITAVSVFVNGEQRQFEMKSSGVGVITVDGPPQVATDPNAPAGAAATPGTADDGTAPAEGTAADGSNNADAAASAAEAQPPAVNTDGDDFVTTYDGYDIYQDGNGVMYFIDEETGVKYNAADGTPYTG